MPALKTTSLWGPDRSQQFSKIAKSDVVITTYLLLARDQKTLSDQHWQAVVLDEAQMVKNPATLAAQTIRNLNCDYRLCLTGTPVVKMFKKATSLSNKIYNPTVKAKGPKGTIAITDVFTM